MFCVAGTFADCGYFAKANMAVLAHFKGCYNLC